MTERDTSAQLDFSNVATEPTRRINTVSEINRAIRWLLEDEIGEVWVEGEISNHRLQTSGHQYFTLKDSNAQLACVLFRSKSAMAPPLKDGLHVQVYGQISVYEARGQYQLVAELVQLRGEGALQVKFEALKRKLQAEGLFDAAHKRPLPKYPARIGIVTSPTGAALRDMLNIFARRAPWIHLVIAPVNVQGDNAAPEIAAAISKFSAGKSVGWPDVDLIIIARGGGSIEDLWAFNEEIVARAIYHCQRPVVSGIGHEIDFTIADFVADLRAPTPSAAAEITAPDGANLRSALGAQRQFLARRAHERIENLALRLARLREGVLKREASNVLRQAAQRLDHRASALCDAIQNALLRREIQLNEFTARLAAVRPARRISAELDRMNGLHRRLRLSALRSFDRAAAKCMAASERLRLLGPQSTLERGYSITLDSKGRIIRSTNHLAPGAELTTRLADGEIQSTVRETKQTLTTPHG